ncbi:MAG TPA: hypothetical protein VGO77_09100, partial [Mycobacterium sp.]|nr:hypothetical protein [Mycobacterium sp.]
MTTHLVTQIGEPSDLRESGSSLLSGPSGLDGSLDKIGRFGCVRRSSNRLWLCGRALGVGAVDVGEIDA